MNSRSRVRMAARVQSVSSMLPEVMPTTRPPGVHWACLLCLSIGIFVVVGSVHEPDGSIGMAKLDFEIYELHVTLYTPGFDATKSPRKLRNSTKYVSLRWVWTVVDPCTLIHRAFQSAHIVISPLNASGTNFRSRHGSACLPNPLRTTHHKLRPAQGKYLGSNDDQREQCMQEPSHEIEEMQWYHSLVMVRI